ncbi:beta-ketoacyl-ACP synthase III [Brevundimonas sp. M20]|uniref:beta-ketoacyl-ACP synthase III n=1 Tax=Brevundimonas sp. M20 TaxID=2591463 RepID=UPI001146F3A4|nr:beta-ketoacyl-ACP synthase III [Brevundimonas sp. M20]QDH73992.1 StlD/DarB family beta-ketosynthase [Brevundimonas sp. M20]
MTRPVYITRTAAFLPNAPVGNDDMERILGQVGPRPSRARRTILRSNGIKSRHYAIDPETLKPTHTNAQLAAEAVRLLDTDLDAVECLACGTSNPDQIMPGHASMVQGELGLQDVQSVSTAGVCMSGMASLKYAWLSVAAGDTDAAVATGSETASAVMSAANFTPEIDARVDALEDNPEIAFEKDFLRWMLSDAAGALLLEPEARAGALNLRVDWIDLHSFSGEMDTCMYMGGVKNEDGSITGWAQFTAEERAAQSVLTVKQDVRLLNDNVLRYTLEKPLPGMAAKRGLKPSDVDFFLPHYSSEFFRDRLYQSMLNVDFDIPQERWFTNLTTRGNTGSASIYVMIDELLASGRLKPGHRLLCWVPESGRFSGSFMHLTVVQG